MFKNVFGSPYIDAFPLAVRSIYTFSKLTFFNVSYFLSTIRANSSQKDSPAASYVAVLTSSQYLEQNPTIPRNTCCKFFKPPP